MNEQLITDENGFVILPEKPVVNVFKLLKAFDCIYNGLNKEQLEVMEKEMAKIMPSDESNVFMAADYDQQAQSVGLSIYVSKPLPYNEEEPITFFDLLFECLLRTDLENLYKINNCLQHLSPTSDDKFSIDGIPVFYTEELDEYDINIKITKEQVQ